MTEAEKVHRILFLISGILILVFICGIGYYVYPLIMKGQQKQMIIDIAQGEITKNSDTIDFEGLKALNPETVGWVSIEGTPLDYPVVQTDNNDYYLSHNFEKNPAIEGTVFLDAVCDSKKSRNDILYGHYMRDETMFGVLWQYQDEAFLKEHNLIKYDRPSDSGEWEIFSVYTTEADYDYRQPEFANDNDFISYMNRVKDRSIYDTGVVLNPTDSVLTLSTCIYTFDNARFVVHARKIIK
ncbi:class B sortase [Acetobacterium sp.]|uniref:class B sortase n=1 Tax=Acetobacterium sp. TaxID=1872094 RepID=UPI002F3EB0C0